MRVIKRFAFLPTKLTNGEWVWGCFFIKVQEYKKVLGEWGFKSVLVTVRKEKIKQNETNPASD